MTDKPGDSLHELARVALKAAELRIEHWQSVASSQRDRWERAMRIVRKQFRELRRRLEIEGEATEAHVRSRDRLLEERAELRENIRCLEHGRSVLVNAHAKSATEAETLRSALERERTRAETAERERDAARAEVERLREVCVGGVESLGAVAAERNAARAEAAEARQQQRLAVEAMDQAHRDLDTAHAECERERARADSALADVRFFKEREAYIARVLSVADGGQYRADWRAPIERLVAERDAAQVKFAELESMVYAVTGATEGTPEEVVRRQVDRSADHLDRAEAAERERDAARAECEAMRALVRGRREEELMDEETSDG